jgi:hypothetical protein
MDRPDLWIRKDDWRNYERYVFGLLQSRFPKSKLTHNAQLQGIKTGRSRQIDILIERNLGGFNLTIAIDCKCYQSKVDVNDVERFLGMLDDIRVSKGILLTTKGFSKVAYERARREPRDIDLQILVPERLSEYQHIGCAWPWKGPVVAIVEAPEGWVVDNQPGQGCQFSMYPLGHTLESAKRLCPFLYGNIVLKTTQEPTMDTIAAMHESHLLDRVPAARFERLPQVWAGDDVTKQPGHLFRVGYISPSYGGPEYTLYLDSPKGVLTLVLLCPEGQDQIYVPLLKWVGGGVIMMTRHEESHTES